MKTKYEKELEKNSLSNLCRMCEGKGLPHTGDKDALIAKLVTFEEAQATEPETPEAEAEAKAKAEAEAEAKAKAEAEAEAEAKAKAEAEAEA